METTTAMKYPQIAAAMRAWRTDKKLSREQAAFRIGVSMATFIRWETGRSAPAYRQFVMIRRELGDAFSVQ